MVTSYQEITQARIENYGSIVKAYYNENENLVNAFFFVAGFVFDILTLGRIDDFFNILSQVAYLTGAYVVMATTHLSLSTKLPGWLVKLLEFRDELFHFFIGGLLSMFTVLYFKSSSPTHSMTFLVLVAVVLILNEVPFFQNLGMTFKAILLKISSTSFLIFFIPILLNTNSKITFYLAILVSLGFSIGLGKLLVTRLKFTPSIVKTQFLIPRYLVLCFFVLFYWTNVIPPLPLSIIDMGIYYSVEKDKNEYHMTTLKPWWKIWHGSNEDFYSRDGDKVCLFVKVFSPGDFKENVYIEWSRFDPATDDWRQSDRVPLSVVGGRDDGYRAFAYKNNYQAGKWRVVVKTEADLILGELDFKIMADPEMAQRDFNTIVDV